MNIAATTRQTTKAVMPPALANNLPLVPGIKDLKNAGIVGSDPKLRRLIKNEGFPPGVLIGRNRVWSRDDVIDWLARRGLKFNSPTQ